MHKNLFITLFILILSFSFFSSKAEVAFTTFSISNLDKKVKDQFDSRADLKLFIVAIEKHQQSEEKEIISIKQWKSFEKLINNLKNELKNSIPQEQEIIKEKLNEIESNYISIEEFLNQYLITTK